MVDGERTSAESKLSTDDLLPIAQLALRILGVYFFVGGATLCIEDIAGCIKLWRTDATFFGIGEGMLFDYLFPARFWGNLAYCLAGVYLTVSGRWLLDNVFSSSERKLLLRQQREMVSNDGNS